MRFISKYAKYMVQVRPQIVEAYATGQSKVIQPQLIAAFDVALVTGEERALARQHFSFNGFAQEQDLVTVVEPDARISAFDSRLAQAEHGWSDEEREAVEALLTKNAEYLPEDLIRIERERLSPPWPSYDQFSGTRQQLAQKIEEDGYDVVDVLAYERENQNRPEIVAALELAADLVAEGLRLKEQMPDLEEELVG
jgi:hypothetical protein